MQAAQVSTRQLYSLVNEVLRSNGDLASRMKNLEREGSILSRTTRNNEADENDEGLPLRNPGRSTDASHDERSSYIDTGRDALNFTFENDLQGSRVYNRAINQRYSMSSLTSTALYTTALSMFSNLSLSQVSNLSFYALPVYAFDINNSSHYIFGEEGAVQGNHTVRISPQAGGVNDTIGDATLAPISSPSPRVAKSPAVGDRRGLLGRFARRRKVPVISAPENPVHVTHVGDNGDEYTVSNSLSDTDAANIVQSPSY